MPFIKEPKEVYSNTIEHIVNLIVLIGGLEIGDHKKSRNQENNSKFDV